MKNLIKFNISGTMPQLQDLLSKLGSYVSDCTTFHTIITESVQPLLQVEIISNREIISEIMDLVDCSDLEGSDSIVSKIQF